MGGLRTPNSITGTRRLCELFAENDGAIATHEEARQAAIAEVNAKYDALVEKPIAENEQIRAKLEPYWQKAGEQLTKGERKTVELGGCIIGSVAGRASLTVAGKPADAAAALAKTSWGKNLVRVSVSPDKAAIAKVIDGKRAKELAELGFAMQPAEDSFVLKRAEQAGTPGAVR
ncbi:MAG: host-nuclease inhibitor Gam family protein [Erythrobacter sp.]|nr:host-nuclease inhibitor Gam family protein [Erythrobacter sp.]